MKIKDNILREKAEHSEFEMAEAEYTMPTLVKVSDNLYVPVNFEDDHNYYADPAGTKRYWGITTILGVIAKPALINWSAGVACDYIDGFIQEVAIHADWQALLDSGKWNEIVREAKVAHNKKKEKAGADGTDIHFEIEKLIKVAMEVNNGVLEAYMVNEAMPEQVKEFVQWAILNNVKFLASEKRLCSPSMFVAGTADFVAEVNGKLMIGDVKTSNGGIYDEHFIQTAAYAQMAIEMGLYKKFEGVVIVNIPKRGGIKVQENYDLEGNFEAFKCALGLFKFKEGRKIKK